jgi:excisionase family DNA binding protein
MTAPKPGAGLAPLGLRIAETAHFLRCSSTTIHRLLASGKLRGVKVGSNTIVTMASIQALRQAAPRTPPPPPRNVTNTKRRRPVAT